MDHVEVMKVARDVDNIATDPSDVMLTDQVAVVTGGGGGTWASSGWLRDPAGSWTLNP